jgi:zinc transport system substrate-binding protein
MKNSLFFICVLFCLVSCKGPQPPTSVVVATNAWTAAYAVAAGATDVRVLTPYDMVHPSEYELRPGDITHLNNADVIIYAGYEIMMRQIRTSLNIPDERMLQIHTSYNMEEIEKSVMLIAAKLGTEEKTKENLNEIRESIQKAREWVIESGLDKVPTAVHFFQQSFVSEVGLQVETVFGPAPPEPRQILDITRTEASLIIDNAHNPSGGVLRETLSGADYLLFLNFPGMHGTRTLVDVIRYNADHLKSAREK